MIILTLILLALLLGLALGIFEIDLPKAVRNIQTFLSELSLDKEALAVGLYALYETVLISLFSTAAAILIAMPMAAVASGHVGSPPLAVAVRVAATFMRSIPAVLWAVLGVVALGPGKEAGAIALFIYSVGYLVKLFYETFENVDKNFVDAMKAIGARGLKLAHLIYLQERRQFITNMIFILEYNIRTATIIGLVGAGGIGYYIAQYISLLKYDALATIIILTFLFVLVLELISYLWRRYYK